VRFKEDSKCMVYTGSGKQQYVIALVGVLGGGGGGGGGEGGGCIGT